MSPVFFLPMADSHIMRESASRAFTLMRSTSSPPRQPLEALLTSATSAKKRTDGIGAVTPALGRGLARFLALEEPSLHSPRLRGKTQNTSLRIIKLSPRRDLVWRRVNVRHLPSLSLLFSAAYGRGRTHKRRLAQPLMIAMPQGRSRRRTKACTLRKPGRTCLAPTLGMSGTSDGRCYLVSACAELGFDWWMLRTNQ